MNAKITPLTPTIRQIALNCIKDGFVKDEEFIREVTKRALELGYTDKEIEMGLKAGKWNQ